MCCAEAGKLALNFVRQENVEQTQDVGDDMENHMTACEEEVVTETTSESEDAITKVCG